MKKTISLLSFGLLGLVAFSQTNNWCGFDAHNAKLNAENPGREQLIHEQISAITHRENPVGTDRTSIIIPVVVHVIHDGGESNISYEQILSGIQMLNEDFNRTNADALDTRNTATAPFEPYAANVSISFELAKIDPDGNCTNGVQRRYSPGVSNNASNNAKHYNTGGLDAWDRNSYMNIWVVNNIESDGEGITLGYAEFPYSGGSSNYGVIIRNDAYGNIGTSTTNERTLTHEIGHCLGLLHTFQGGCHSDDCADNGDYCCDTPPEAEAHWSCGASQNSCGDIPAGDAYGFDAFDQWENFMSYAPCQNMFSEDQKTIMLDNLTNITFLANLTSLTNQSETGVGQPEVLCAAVFSSNTYVICAGSSVQFFDESYFNVTGRTWNFSGGTPSTSTDQNPVITFDAPGIYDISLEVTDGVSSVNTIANDYLIVLANPGESLPYSEGFEDMSEFPDNQKFLVQNDDSGPTWDITSSTSFQGEQCLKLKNFGEADDTKDAFISGPIDLSGVDPEDDIVFNFQYAYVKRSASNDEWLQFYVSKDCGQTWALRKNIHGDELSETTSNLPYTPDDTSEWTQVNVTNINSVYYVSNFMYKFVFTNDGGNNIYIDNINLYPQSMTGLTEENNDLTISVYPNPASENLSISFYSNSQKECTIQITNSLGQIVSTVYSGEIISGEQFFDFSVQNLSSGVYYISVLTESGTKTIKFIKE